MSLALDPRVIDAGAAPGLIPVAPVAVPAGYPSPSQDYFSSEIDLNEHLIQDKTSTFIVRVSGDSMEPAGISDGDEFALLLVAGRPTAGLTWRVSLRSRLVVRPRSRVILGAAQAAPVAAARQSTDCRRETAAKEVDDDD